MMIALYCIAVFTFVYCFALTISEAIEEKNDKKRRLGMLLVGAICLASAIFTLYTIKDSMTVETKFQEYKTNKSFREHNEKDQKKTFIIDKKTYEAFKKDQSEKSPKKEE